MAVSRALRLPLSRWQTIETLFISNFYALVSPGPVLSGAITVYRYNHYGASVRGSLMALLISRAIECTTFLMLGAGALLADGRALPNNPVGIRLLFVTAGVLAAAAILSAGMVLRPTAHPSSDPVDEAATKSALVRATARLHELRRALPHEVCRRLLRALLPAAGQALLSAAALAIFAAALAVHVPLLTALWTSAAVYIAVLLPISVIGLGVREATLIHCLATTGVSPAAAVAVSALLFSDPLLNSLVGGLLQLRSFARSTSTGARQV